MPVFRNALIKPYAYYQTGGTCDVLYEPQSVDELVQAVKEIKKDKQKYFVLGGGTNSLVSDQHFPGAVIVCKGLSTLQARGSMLVAGAGVDNTAVAHLALQQGLAGAAWMNRLPGQIGGTVRMNARCYGGEIGQICTKVTVVAPDGEIKTYQDPSVFRGYKDTVFMRSDEIIVSAELTLKPGNKTEIETKMRFCESDRVGKGQFDWPTCGCVFKNDYSVGVSSGILLDEAGGKTLKNGRIAINPHHANFVYNKGGGSLDVLDMTFKMRELVFKKFGVWMAYEMEILGDVSDDLKEQLETVRAGPMNEALLAPLRAKMKA